MNGMRIGLAGSLLLGTLCLATAERAGADPADPLGPLIQKADAFLHRGETGGVTFETRHLSDFPEQIRLTVVAQLLGYCELARVSASTSLHQDIVDRADFLARYGSGCRSFDAADGMLGYALLRAYEVVGDTRYRDAAQPIVSWCRDTPGIELPLNRGLMAALALAQHYRLTGDPAALARVHELVLLAARSQHADGSFAHVCDASRDIHYTAWISMELDRIGELVNDPNVERILALSLGFLRGRVTEEGSIRYQDSLPSGATIYYYSRPVCPSDYDTRGWANELAYHALLFDREQDARYHGVMSRLLGLETQGAFPDKWDFVPPPSDPTYLWSSSPRSVMRTSVIFWTLAAVEARREGRPPVAYRTSAAASPDAGADLATSAAPSPTGVAWLAPPAPNPARGGAWIGWRLPQAGPLRLSLFDASGRRVRALWSGFHEAGADRLRWDGRDDVGARVAPGVYFVRLEAEGQVHRATLILLD